MMLTFGAKCDKHADKFCKTFLQIVVIGATILI